MTQVLDKRGIQYVQAILLIAYFKGKIETTFLDCRVGLLEGHQRTRLLCLPPSSSRAYPLCCAFPCKRPNTPYLLQHGKTAGVCTSVWERICPCRERVKEDNKTQQVQAHKKEIKQNSLLMGAIEITECGLRNLQKLGWHCWVKLNAQSGKTLAWQYICVMCLCVIYYHSWSLPSIDLGERINVWGLLRYEVWTCVYICNHSEDWWTGQ